MPSDHVTPVKMQSKVGVRGQVRIVSLWCMHRQEVGELHLVMVATAVYKLENILTCLEEWEAAICTLPPILYPDVKIHPSTQLTRDLHQPVVY